MFLLGAAVTSASGIRMHYHLKLVESGEGNFDFTREFFLPTPAYPGGDVCSRT